MSYDQKLEAASNRIQQHNDVLGEDVGSKINFDTFAKTLKQLGATSEESLGKLTWEDVLDSLNSSFPSFDASMSGPSVKPKQLAREIAAIFRDKNEAEPAKISSKKVKGMSHKELVENLDIFDIESDISKRLAVLSKNQPFIVLDAQNKPIVDKTHMLLRELMDGYPPRPFIDVDGDPKPIYAIGDVPDAYVEENPLYPGRPLRPDGTCDQLNRSWAGVDLKVRQFLRVAMVNCGQISVDAIDNAHNLLDIALQYDPLKTLKSRYAKSALRFNELEKENKLPSLQLKLKRENPVQKPVAFTDGKKVEFQKPIKDYYFGGSAAIGYYGGGSATWNNNNNTWVYRGN